MAWWAVFVSGGAGWPEAGASSAMTCPADGPPDDQHLDRATTNRRRSDLTSTHVRAPSPCRVGGSGRGRHPRVSLTAPGSVAATRRYRQTPVARKTVRASDRRATTHSTAPRLWANHRVRRTLTVVAVAKGVCTSTTTVRAADREISPQRCPWVTSSVLKSMASSISITIWSSVRRWHGNSDTDSSDAYLASGLPLPDAVSVVPLPGG